MFNFGKNNINDLKEGDVFTIKRWLGARSIDKSYIGDKLIVVAIGSKYITFITERNSFGTNSILDSPSTIEKCWVEIGPYEDCCRCKCRCCCHDH